MPSVNVNLSEVRKIIYLACAKQYRTRLRYPQGIITIMLTQNVLASAAATRSIDRTELHAAAHGFAVTAKLRRHGREKLCADQGEVRAFKSMDTHATCFR